MSWDRPKIDFERIREKKEYNEDVVDALEQASEYFVKYAEVFKRNNKAPQRPYLWLEKYFGRDKK